MLDKEADSVTGYYSPKSRMAAQIYQAARQLARFSEKGFRGGQLCRLERTEAVRLGS